MASVVVTRHSQVTIPKKLREILGINEGDRVSMRIEGSKLIMEKMDEKIWSDCTDFLPENFEKIRAELSSDSRKRFKRLGILS
jgi:AbrB family looped-hinge helix DNA binding protein